MTIPEISFDPTNPDPRCACVLVLDISTSMRGEAIAQLNEGLQVFQAELQTDNVARMRTEVAIVTFGPTALFQPFIPASDFVAPTLIAKGKTTMGSAMQMALDIVHERKQLYQQNAIPYYRPWVFLISDGAPTDAWKRVAATMRQAEQEKKLAVFAVGVKGADLEVLNQFSNRPAVTLRGYSFREMFVWLSASLRHVSSSQVGSAVALTPPTSWVEL
ncbi:MAG: vWA domain-containing protein [Chloroflexota bacterium]|jgi:uncharacterized protein YegL